MTPPFLSKSETSFKAFSPGKHFLTGQRREKRTYTSDDKSRKCFLKPPSGWGRVGGTGSAAGSPLVREQVRDFPTHLTLTESQAVDGAYGDIRLLALELGGNPGI